MKPESRTLIKCDKLAGVSAGLKVIAVLEADDGITVRELSELLRVGSCSAKQYITSAISKRWLYKTEETRGGIPIYRRTTQGNQLTKNILC